MDCPFLLASGPVRAYHPDRINFDSSHFSAVKTLWTSETYLILLRLRVANRVLTEADRSTSVIVHRS